MRHDELLLYITDENHGAALSYGIGIPCLSKNQPLNFLIALARSPNQYLSSDQLLAVGIAKSKTAIRTFVTDLVKELAKSEKYVKKTVDVSEDDPQKDPNDWDYAYIVKDREVFRVCRREKNNIAFFLLKITTNDEKVIDLVADRGHQTADIPIQAVLCSEQTSNPWFVGRDGELEQIRDNFRGSTTRKAVRMQAVTGPGGVGKTCFATEYAMRYKDDYEQPLFFCRASSEKELFEDYCSIAAILFAEDPTQKAKISNRNDANYPKNIKQLVKRWLTESSSYLLILDNADLTTDDIRNRLRSESGRAAIAAVRNRQIQVGPSELDKILQDEKWLAAQEQMTENELNDFLPAQPGGHILLTTRNERFTGDLKVSNTVELWELAHVDAVRLLVERVYGVNHLLTELTTDEQVAVSNLVEVLHHFPLALEQAAAFIEQKRWSYQKYLHRYREVPEKDAQAVLAFIGQADVRVGKYHASVATTWQISMGAVQAVNPASVELLQFAAHVAPSNITLSMVYQAGDKGCQLIAGTFSTAENENNKEDCFSELLEPLRDYSLIKTSIGRTAFDVHPMIQTVVRAILGAVQAAEGVA